MYRKLSLALPLACMAIGVFIAPSAQSAVSFGIDAGTLGAGAELQFGLTGTLNARLGFTAFSYSRNVTDTGITYDGKLKLSNGLALLEWHPGRSAFKVSLGAVATSNKVDITGLPSGGSYQLGNNTYPASDFGIVTGTVKAGNGVAPYLGIGFGNPVGEGSHLTFLFDLGVIYTGAPKVSLSASCTAAVPAATCAQIQQDAAAEVAKLEANSTQLKVWPVLNLGLAYRF